MARQSFRDVNTVLLAGSAVIGVQRVLLSDEGAVINYNSDANAYRQDVGLTKQVATVEIERLSSNKQRDIVSGVFTSAGVLTAITFGRVQRAQISQRGTVLRDSGDSDSWVAYVGVTNIGGEVDLTFRDLKQFRTGILVKGRKGTLTLSVPVQRTSFGLPASTATETHKLACMVSQFEDRVGHSELGEGRAKFEMFGSVDPWTASGTTLKPCAVGTRGSVKWTAPAADASSAEAVTVTGGIVSDVEVTLEHGGFARSRIKSEHASADGVTAPIT